MLGFIADATVAPNKLSNSFGPKSPPLGLFRVISSRVITSPACSSRVATTDANANAIVTSSSVTGIFEPLVASWIILDPSISSVSSAGVIEQTMSGPGLSFESVKCRSSIEVPSPTEAKHG